VNVRIEWMDGVVLDVDHAEHAEWGSDRVLRVYGYLTGGRRPLLAEVPMYHVRQIRRSGPGS
jgi:hypothetical protein